MHWQEHAVAHDQMQSIRKAAYLSNKQVNRLGTIPVSEQAQVLS
jgi:hypothetical protein